jgi:hypothetical protein
LPERTQQLELFPGSISILAYTLLHLFIISINRPGTRGWTDAFYPALCQSLLFQYRLVILHYTVTAIRGASVLGIGSPSLGLQNRRRVRQLL